MGEKLILLKTTYGQSIAIPIGCAQFFTSVELVKHDGYGKDEKYTYGTEVVDICIVDRDAIAPAKS